MPSTTVRGSLLGIAAALMSTALAPALAQADTLAHQVIVRYDAGATAADRADARDAVDGTVDGSIRSGRMQLLDVDGSAAAAARTLNRDGDVDWAEPNRPVSALWTPNDPNFGWQWAALNTGQWGGTATLDLDLPAAWDITRGSSSVLLGVVDTGVEWNNQDLASAHWWTNPGEIAGNGIDDDNDGYVDDVHGWDFQNNDNDPADDNGHGTATTGTAAADTDDGVGMAGVAGGSTIIEAKALGANGSGSSWSVAQAMDYEASRGAKIVNLSIGGGYSSSEAAVVAAHPNTLFVAAAGNWAKNNDGSEASYPCALTAANVLCAGASTNTDTVASFSNYGRTSVDLMAPGVNIAAPSLGGGTMLWSGTSFSSPLTAGVAALLLAHKPSASVADLKAAIMNGGDPVTAFSTVSVTGKRLNALGALKALDGSVAPPEGVHPPTLAGLVRVGDKLTASPGTWSRGRGAMTSYAWQRCDSGGGSCQPIDGATGRTYVVAMADVGATLRVAVTMTTSGGPATASSAATIAVPQPPPAPTNSSAPAISGTPGPVGTVLTAAGGSWDNLDGVPGATTKYQWQRCTADGTTCTDIPRDTGQRHTISAADADMRLRVRVTASTRYGSGSAASATGSQVLLAPRSLRAPGVTGWIGIGRTLNASTGTWSGSAATLSYQWMRCLPTGNDCAAIGGATASTYTLTSGDAGRRLRVVVTATNGAGTTSATSNPTATVPLS